MSGSSVISRVESSSWLMMPDTVYERRPLEETVSSIFPLKYYAPVRIRLTTMSLGL